MKTHWLKINSLIFLNNCITDTISFVDLLLLLKYICKETKLRCLFSNKATNPWGPRHCHDSARIIIMRKSFGANVIEFQDLQLAARAQKNARVLEQHPLMKEHKQFSKTDRSTKAQASSQTYSMLQIICRSWSH